MGFYCLKSSFATSEPNTAKRELQLHHDAKKGAPVLRFHAADFKKIGIVSLYLSHQLIALIL